MIPFGGWAPDQPPFGGQHLIEAKNVLPREDSYYGPLGAFAATTAVLPAQCVGIVAPKTTAGVVKTFAGTASNIYGLGNDGNWTSVGKVGGYSLDTGARWRFQVFGDCLIALGGVLTTTQSFDLASGSIFADNGGGTPNASYGAVVRDFLMLGRTFDLTQGTRPDQVWWSAIGNPASFPAPGTAGAIAVQSSRQVLPDGGYIQGILSGIGGADAAIFGENRIWRVVYEGSPTVFRFDPVEIGRGVYADGSIVGVGRLAFYLAEDGFYAFDGAQSVPIGSGKIDNHFLADLDDSFKDNMWSGADAQNKVVYWLYPGRSNVNGIPNRLIIYNYATGNWTRAEVAGECLGEMEAIGYTLDSLDTLGYTMETLPFSLDSRVWSGGGRYLGLVNTDHKLGQMAGAPLQADLTTAEVSGPNESRIFINNGRIFTDCVTVQLALGYRDSNQAAVTSTSYVTQDEDQCPHLVACRYARGLVRMPASTSWTVAYGYHLNFRAEGLR